MADSPRTADTGAWKREKGRGSWETYWRYGYEVEGTAVVIEKFGRGEKHSMGLAEQHAARHHKELENLGIFREVKPFAQQWRTRNLGDAEEYSEAVFSTAVVLRPQTRLTPAEAITRRLRAEEQKQSEQYS